jgi:hypothetical protein
MAELLLAWRQAKYRVEVEMGWKVIDRNGSHAYFWQAVNS